MASTFWSSSWGELVRSIRGRDWPDLEDGRADKGWNQLYSVFERRRLPADRSEGSSSLANVFNQGHKRTKLRLLSS